MIELISNKYNKNIILQPALEDSGMELVKGFSKELYSLLKQSNGIGESMLNSITSETEQISWIVYPYEVIIEESNFYKENYAIEGNVFSSDGAGNPYYIKEDGRIYLFEVIDNEEIVIANSLEDFFG